MKTRAGFLMEKFNKKPKQGYNSPEWWRSSSGKTLAWYASDAGSIPVLHPFSYIPVSVFNFQIDVLIIPYSL